MRGWFDAFREAGGPTLYASQRIAATHDNILIGLYTTFAALFFAFLIIIPGIRRNRAPTFVLLSASMFVLASIVICRFSPNWHVSSSSILASYKRTTPQKLPGVIGVQIGLEFFNVTLKITESNYSAETYSKLRLHHPQLSSIQFNERYSWIDVEEVKNMYQQSLERGLPYPILTVAEVLSMDAAGFAWGRSYREAGYYAGIILWSALASWALVNILFCLVPRFSGYFMLLTGGLLLGCDVVYDQLLPSPTLIIRFEHGSLVFGYGWCFWMIMAAGLLCISFGVGTVVSDFFFPQLLTEVHTSWRYSSKVLPPGAKISNRNAALFHKTASAPASIIQVRPFPEARPPSPVHHSLSAVNWTTTTVTSSDAPCEPDDCGSRKGCTIVEDPFLEEIDRFSDIPYTHTNKLKLNEGETEESKSKDPENSLDASSGSPLGDLPDVPRDGLGYVNPVIWDINMAENIENTRL